MGLLSRLFGRRNRYQQDGYGTDPYGAGPRAAGPADPDQQAIERYRYLLRTAPPEQIEQAHAEAFEKLTPDQRQQVLAQLAATVPAGERPRTDDARTLARAATRAELRRPGTLERAFGGYGPGYGGGGYGGGYGPSFGGMMGASLLGTVGGLVVGTAVADALFDTGPGDGGLFGGGGDYGDRDYGDRDYGDQNYADGNYDDGGGYDTGGGDFGGGDFGGDF